MAGRDNFFRQMKIPFDPAPSDEAQIAGMLNTFVDSVERNFGMDPTNLAYAGLKKRVPEMRRVMLDPAAREVERRAAMDEATAMLNARIAVEKAAGKRFADLSALRVLSRQLGLAEERVRRHYEDAGFVVRTREALAAELPERIPVTQAEAITTNLDALRRALKMPQPLEDLYTFIAHLEGKRADAALYRNLAAADLCAVAKDHSYRFITQHSDVGLYYKTLCALAETVFSGEEGRAKYDTTLQYRRIEPILSTIRLTGAQELGDTGMAEAFVAEIQKVFQDRGKAVAIYNEECRKKKAEPFLPVADEVSVTCVCGRVWAFPTAQEATDATCTCGVRLYCVCPKCRRKVPRASAVCPTPKCGFRLAERANVDAYRTLAEDALEEGNLAEAERLLARLQRLTPRSVRNDLLKARVEALREELSAPLAAIAQQIADCRIGEAERTLLTLIEKNPSMQNNLVAKRVEAIAWRAGEDYRRMLSERDERRAYAFCRSILSYYKDHALTLQWLRANPPGPPQEVSARVEARTGHCHVTWLPSASEDVTYQVLRAANVKGGDAQWTMLREDVYGLNFVDTTCAQGIHYRYAVRTARYGALSGSSVSWPILIARDIDAATLRAEVGDGVCALTWQLPERAVEARVFRDGGAGRGSDGVLVAAQCQDRYVDRAVTNGVRYRYRLQAGYADAPGEILWTPGIEVTVEPSRIPERMSVAIQQVEADGYVARWPTGQYGFRVYLMQLGKPGALREGEAYPWAEVERLGTPLAEPVDISAGHVAFLLPRERLVSIAPVIRYGEYALACGEQRISTLLPVSECQSEFTDSTLRLRFRWPDAASAVEWRVSRDWDGEKAWVGGGKAWGSWRQGVVDRQSYDAQGALSIGGAALAEGVYYVTLYAIYEVDGQPFCAEACKHRAVRWIPADIHYRVRWGRDVLGRRRRKGAALEVVFDPTEFHDQLPPLVLVSSTMADDPALFRDKRALMTTRAMDSDGEQMTESWSIPEAESLIPGELLRLVVADGRHDERYSIGLLDGPDNLIIPPR